MVLSFTYAEGKKQIEKSNGEFAKNIKKISYFTANNPIKDYCIQGLYHLYTTLAIGRHYPAKLSPNNYTSCTIIPSSLEYTSS